MGDGAMSCAWGFPPKKILASDAFDGRLEKTGIWEDVVPGETTEQKRCLTDGTKFMWVFLDGGGYLWAVRGFLGIADVIADLFQTELITEYDSQFYGFETWDEFDAALEATKSKRDEKDDP
jgi:hypothetical protein